MKCGAASIKGEGNFQNNLCWFNTGPPILPKYISEKAITNCKMLLGAHENVL